MKKSTQSLRPIDEPHYGYWQALFLSFFSSRLYVDVAKRWKGFSLMYLALLCLIAIIPFYFKIVTIFNTSYEENLITPLGELPLLIIQNGQVSADVSMPYFVKNSKGKVIFIVDTSGSITQFDKKYPDLAFLITKNQMIFRPGSYANMNDDTLNSVVKDKIITKNLPKDLNQIFDAKKWMETSNLNTVKRVVDVFLYPLLASAIFGTYLVILFALSLMAQFVAKILIKAPLTYIESFRLLMVSATPQIILTLTLGALDYIFPGYGLVSLALLAVYFSFAAIVVKRASNKMVFS